MESDSQCPNTERSLMCAGRSWIDTRNQIRSERTRLPRNVRRYHVRTGEGLTQLKGPLVGGVDRLVDGVVTDPRSRIPWELNPRLACDHPGCPPRPELVCHPPLPSDPAQTLVAGAS